MSSSVFTNFLNELGRVHRESYFRFFPIKIGCTKYVLTTFSNGIKLRKNGLDVRVDSIFNELLTSVWIIVIGFERE